MNIRLLAQKTLMKAQKNSSFSNLALSAVIKENLLDSRDAAFLTALYYGTLERIITLDYYIDCFSKQPSRSLKPQVLWALRLGIYQLLYMDSVPDSAAVNESVTLVKQNGCAFAAGYTNALLHTVARSRASLPVPQDRQKRLSVAASVPIWLIKHIQRSYPDIDTQKVIMGLCRRPKTYIKVNTQKNTAEQLIEILKSEGTDTQIYCEDVLCCDEGIAPNTSTAFLQGRYFLSDIASIDCAKLLCPKPGERILDCCAAPGGKSFTLCELTGDRAEIVSSELYPKRAELVREGARRLGHKGIKVRVADATRFNSDLGTFDRILCDVPCSGLGTAAKKPEIKYKDKSVLEDFSSVQTEIIETSAKYLKHGGVLVYSTCTLNPRENEETVNGFLSRHKDFHQDSEMKTRFCGIDDGDGFFYVRLIYD